MTATPRFYEHNDGNFMVVAAPPITLERFLFETVGWLTGTQVDGIICHMFTFGDVAPMYRSETADTKVVFPERALSVNVWKQMKNIEAILSFDRDPWAAAIEMAHGQGKPFWGAMRFNDAHPLDYGMRSTFCLAHPEYRLGDRCGGPIHGPNPDGSIPDCLHLDFSIPEVRAHRLALVEDVCGCYDLDGFEWDFTRDFGHNYPGDKAAEGPGMITEMMREARAILDRIGQQRGRPIELGVRVPGTPECCATMGIEIEQWISDRIIDVATPTVYYDTTCELPYDRFVDMARDSTCRVYASVTEGVGPGRFRPPPKEAVRGAALNAWRQDVDGINLFNFHHHEIANRSEDMALLGEIGDPVTLAGKDKLYMVAGTAVPCQSRFFGLPYDTAHHHQLPADLAVEDAAGLRIRLPVGDDVQTARADRLLDSITLILDLVEVTGDEEIALRINGASIPFDEGRFDVSDQYPWNWNGQRGHFSVTFDVTRFSEHLVQGDNEIDLVLKDRPTDIHNPLVLYALRLWIRYRGVPMGCRDAESRLGARPN
ncbi:MAG: hypothetical protein CMJ18_06920 [Phycisphaeraceae bacterium]|nr:hypothetical protein [Phycisphaeraceae bacterium]